jgi:signal transduction histidine kinase/Na+/proline symporter
MRLDPGWLAVVTLVYLGLLFVLAEAAERGWIPRRIAQHPWVSALSLGVYASTWSFYGSVGFASAEGYRYLTIYLGVSLACLLIPVVWMPVLRLSREHQLSSLADLFAFRYRSRAVGVAVTLFLLFGSLPYLAQQIRAVAASVHILTGRGSPGAVGLGFCALVAAFAVLFGARHVTAREKHAGLVVAIAFESLVKLVALLCVAGFALFGIFDGPAGLAEWLRAHPEATERLYAPVLEGPWGSLLLVSFAAAFLLPRQYHMAFTEAHDERSLRTAAWLFPLFLLLLNLAIPIILWAGKVTDPLGGPDAYVLTTTLRGAPSWLPVFVYLGGVSAASAMVIVTVLALASMCLNHLVLARTGAAQERDLYAFLRWKRRGLVILILLAAYGIFLVIGLDEQQRLVELGLVSFVAVAQFLPGLVGVLFWRGASGVGVLAGLCAGIACWLLLAALPLLVRSHLLGPAFDLSAFLGIPPGDTLAFATWMSLGTNACLMGWLSLRRPPRAVEAMMARVCIDAGEVFPGGRMEADSPDDFARALAPLLGPDAAAQEVAHALDDVGLSADERHPTELRRLRDQLLRNLSGLLGPLVAESVVDAGLRLEHDPTVGDKLRAIEARGTRRIHLTDELDQVRRYLRDVLQDLPVGVCAVGTEDDVVLWNRALSEITGIGDAAAGDGLSRLAAPWGPILSAFARDPVDERRLTAPRTDGEIGRYSLRKSTLSQPVGHAPAGLVIVLEDLTERATLEARLEHHERLALIGQLAATVAHEIGNPLAAIASVAQNLQSELDDADVRGRLSLIRDQVQRIGEIVKAMVVYSRAGTSAALSPSRSFSLGEAVDEAVSLVRLDPRGRTHDIHNRCATELHLFGDRTRIIQVFINLLHNACDASPEGESIEVRADARGDRARIEIVDHGAGVPPEVRQRIFEPFFTTKDPGKGAGLGLSLVANIVREHGGTLELDSEAGAGTVIRLSLPVEAMEAKA